MAGLGVAWPPDLDERSAKLAYECVDPRLPGPYRGPGDGVPVHDLRAGAERLEGAAQGLRDARQRSILIVECRGNVPRPRAAARSSAEDAGAFLWCCSCLVSSAMG